MLSLSVVFVTTPAAPSFTRVNTPPYPVTGAIDKKYHTQLATLSIFQKSFLVDLTAEVYFYSLKCTWYI